MKTTKTMNEFTITIPSEYQRLYKVKSPVVKVPHAILRQKATMVTKFSPKLHNIIRDMKAVMQSNRGVGIAAPQLGIGKRICIIYTPWDSTQVLINPEITAWSEEKIESEEGCLSIPGLHGIVSRHSCIDIKFQDAQGKECMKTLTGLAAVVTQHEVDHLNGILFTDRAKAETLFWKTPRKT
jgi:peptide deformylase